MKAKLAVAASLFIFVVQAYAESGSRPDARMAIIPMQPIWLTGISRPDPYSKSYPAPAESEHYRVVNAGYWITRRAQSLEVVYEFTLSITKPFSSLVYTRVTLENPKDPLSPTVYEGSVNPATGEKTTKALHGPVTGLVDGNTYQMKLQVFSDAARTVQVEEVVQPVVSPISEKNGCIALGSSAQEFIKLPFPLACAE